MQMPPLCMYLFNREGKRLFYRQWRRPQGLVGQSEEDDSRVVFGLTFTLQTFCANIDPTPGRTPVGKKLHLGDGCAFRGFATSTYRLHFFVSPSGLRFVLLTSPEHDDCQEILREVYFKCYCPFVSCNPLAKPGEVIENDGFARTLEEVLRPLGRAAS